MTITRKGKKKVAKRRNPCLPCNPSTRATRFTRARRNPYIWEDDYEDEKVYETHYILTSYPDNKVNIETYTKKDPQDRTDYLHDRGYQVFILTKEDVKTLIKKLQKLV